MPDRPQDASDNFQFLRQYARLLAQLFSGAERNRSTKCANTGQLELRQFGESLLKHVWAVQGLEWTWEPNSLPLGLFWQVVATVCFSHLPSSRPV